MLNLIQGDDYITSGCLGTLLG